MTKRSHLLVMLFLIATQLLWPSHSFATDYYVHVNVGDNRNSGLQPNNAFSTLSYAMQQLGPGDTLYLRSGTYDETVYLRSSQYSNGTSANPITIKSYPNETPVIGSNVAAFAVIDMQWWIFEDLIFQNSKALILGRRDTSLPENNQCIWAENILIRRVRFQHSSANGMLVRCAKNIRIENNVFDNLRSRIAGRDAFGMLLSYRASNITISGNHFRDIGANGIQFLDSEGSQYVDIAIISNEFEIVRPYTYRDLTGAVVADPGFGNVGEVAIGIKKGPGPIVVENNTIHGFRPTLPGQDATGSIGNGLAILNQASGIAIRKNHFYDNVIHLSTAQGDNIEERPDRNLTISNNIFEEPADPGIYGNQVPSGLRLNSASNIKLFNNTFYNQLGFDGWVLQILNTDNVELKNNVFNNGIISINPDSVTNLVADHNAWSGITGNTWTGEIYPVVLGVNDVSADNLGIDSLTWSPLQNSPLIDSGEFVGISEDFYSSVTTGSAPDIGAVEYVSQNDGSPGILITSPTDGSSVSGDVQVTAVASDDVGVTQVTFAIDGVWAGKDTTAPYTFKWDSTTHADGIAKIQATAFDATGKTSKYTLDVTVNNQGPDIEEPSVAITAPSDGAAVSGNVQISATASDNVGVSKVTFAIDGVWAGKDTTAPYSFNWDSTTHADGIATVQATAFDAAGNTDTYTLSITVNNQSPDPDTEVPGILITSPSDGATVSGNVQVSATASDNTGVTKVTFAIDGVWAGKDTTAPYSFNWDSTTHADGIAKVQATAFDAAGNTDTYTLSVTVNNQGPDPDTEVPGILITSPGDGATVSGNVQVSATASDNVGVTKVTFAIDGVWAGKDTTAPYSFNWDTTTHADGIAKVQATAFDAAGNTRRHTLDVTVYNQSLDTKAPVISVPPDKTREATAEFTSVNLGTASATDDIDGTVAVTPSTSGPFSIGTHLITWTATDAAGNIATATQTITVVDTTPPVVTAPADITLQSTGSLTEVQLGSAAAVDLVDGSLNAIPSTTGPFPVGTHSVIWRASDTTGNTGTDTQLITINEQVDTTPPVISPPADVTVGATGVLTDVDLGNASAYDDVSGALTPVPDNLGPFTSGIHQILWHATDAAGNIAEAAQYVTVLPQANFSVDQNVSEGSTVTVTVLLSGEAAAYPVSVPYIVTGTAVNPHDHNATDGVIVISSGTTGSLSFQTVDDGVNGESANTVVFEMQTPTNAVPGAITTHTATIFEENIGPLVDFNVTQAGVPTRTVYVYDGPVVVSASVRDPNLDDKHYYDWSSTDNRLFSDVGTNIDYFSFDPQYLEPGLYKLNVTVVDSGVPAESTSAEVVINVVMDRPHLSDLEDQDHDGLSDATEGTVDTDQDGIPDYLDSIDNPAILQGLSGLAEHHLLVTDAGVQLELGATALAAGQASALVTPVDISNFGDIDGGSGATSKRSSDFPGGLYDFAITGLTEAGQSVRIVLPQFAPIPKAAVYRKYIPGIGWQNFVTDGVNKIASAPGSNGVCPAPGDKSYKNGLHAGNYCIQLTIVDGGPNDTDGIANGVIRDPGGAEIDSQTSTGIDSSSSGSSPSGGCTINTSMKIDPAWLLILLISSAGYVRSRFH